MDNIWPKKFIILRDNFKEEIGERVIRSNMDVGPAKIRRRTILAVSKVQFIMMLSLDDYKEFKEFYYNHDFGVFQFTRPDTKEVVQARFASVPSASANETLWTVACVLEIMP